MSALPPVTKSLIPAVVCPGLLPIRFGLKPYLDLCHKFDAALAELEMRYPARHPVVTLETRNKLLKRRPK
jgi:hypothetical protein